jgi:hypothetical protein
MTNQNQRGDQASCLSFSEGSKGMGTVCLLAINSKAFRKADHRKRSNKSNSTTAYLQLVQKMINLTRQSMLQQDHQNRKEKQ